MREIPYKWVFMVCFGSYSHHPLDTIFEYGGILIRLWGNCTIKGKLTIRICTPESKFRYVRRSTSSAHRHFWKNIVTKTDTLPFSGGLQWFIVSVLWLFGGALWHRLVGNVIHHDDMLNRHKFLFHQINVAVSLQIIMLAQHEQGANFAFPCKTVLLEKAQTCHTMVAKFAFDNCVSINQANCWSNSLDQAKLRVCCWLVSKFVYSN